VGLKTNHTVVAVGLNEAGQCNVGNWTDIGQVAAGTGHTVGLKTNGTVVAVGTNNAGQCNVGGWTNITRVAAGGSHTVGLKTNGTVVAVGSNDYGQCSVGNWTDIIQVAAGAGHTVGLKTNGTVVAVGNNAVGQCNVGGWSSITQVAAVGYQTVGLKSDGTVVAVGSNDYGQCNVGGWSGITQVAAGWYHTVGLKSDGTVVAVGQNVYGQCGAIVTKRVKNATVDAIAEADTEVVVNGTATVTIFKYASNPHPGSLVAYFGYAAADSSDVALGKYIDVSVNDTGAVTEIQIKLYYTDAEVTAANVSEESLQLFWFNGTKWEACSNTGVNTTDITIDNHDYSGYMWAEIRETGTTPTLSQLTGTPFGGYGHPSTPPVCGCFIATAAYGTNTAKELDILREFRDSVLLSSSLGAEFVSLYYKTSLPVANFISQHEVLRTAVRVGFVDPIVKILNWTHGLWSARGS
jgi:hypothetical protein